MKNTMVKLKKGNFYKTNWYTKKKPEYGYFTVLDIKDNIVTILEKNPWGGGPWETKHNIDSVHLKGYIKVPKLMGLIKMFKNKEKK